MREIQFREALNEAISEEMRRDKNVYLMGEEVAEYNGAYKVSQGMLEEFGERRVIDTPISESGFSGIGIGSTMTGNGNAEAQPEVLACFGDLADRLQNATITEIELITPLKGGEFDKSEGGNISVRVRWNEAVTVTGTPHFVVNNITDAARHQTCLYVSGSGTNELVFTKTLGANSGDISAGD